MKNSGNSSATASPGPPCSSTSSTPRPDFGTRRTFALTGPSGWLDPRTHAVRGDLADIRLADQVFAPHYAEPIICRVCRATPLLARAGDGEAIADLKDDDIFELLELAGANAWGVAPGPGLVGYCDRQALEPA